MSSEQYIAIFLHMIFVPFFPLDSKLVMHLLWSLSLKEVGFGEGRRKEGSGKNWFYTPISFLDEII